VRHRVTVDTNPAIAPVVPFWLSVLPCRDSPDPQYSVPGGACADRRSGVERPPQQQPAARGE
jgi:hypothetical protein